MAGSFWDSQTKPIAIAHRGGAGLYDFDRYRQENTLSVFKAAVALGYQYLELDVTNTADNKVIVLHVTADKFEAMLLKPSAPSGDKLKQYTLVQLKKKLGRDIPLLEEVLAAFPKTRFLIDAKTDEVIEPLAKVIKKTKSMGRVYLNSFFIDRVLRLQQLLGHQLNCGVIIGRHPRLFNSRLRALDRGDYFGKGFAAITIPRRFLNKKMLSLIHRHGIKALVWAPNTEEQINQAVSLRVDGIISDNAKLLISRLKPNKNKAKKA
jgi:glycerophosphoryl diester phosphodiesterase